jgi:heme-degrading monooxygenase HmoA
MHARVTIVEGDPSMVDNATRVVEEQVLPAARQIAGFKGVISVSDRTTGKTMTLTLWESEQAMQASEEAANRLRADTVAAIGAREPTVERYEVTLFETT